MAESEEGSIRLLVVARHPFRLDDFAPELLAEVEEAQLVRRPAAVETAMDEHAPNVVVVDTAFPEARGIELIAEVLAVDPDVQVLALTPDPSPPDQVARATRAGAVGFVDVGAEPEELAGAVRAVHPSGTWFPVPETRTVLSGVASDLDVTKGERRSRLTGVVLGLIPLTGAIAALMSFMWRRYLGQIGVRPVDLAVDPASRVIDGLFGVATLIGVFGPLLYVGTWIDLLRDSRLDRGPLAWLLERPRTARLVISALVLLVGIGLALGQNTLLVLFIGPLVGVSILASALGASDELPRWLRIEQLSPRRLLAGTLLAVVIFLAVLGAEVILVGPDLRTDGEHGRLAPRVLGFNALPMRAYDVDGDGEPREVLYLGGNADLYVLVDPCNDDEVEYVSVGATRLVVIDEVTC